MGVVVGVESNEGGWSAVDLSGVLRMTSLSVRRRAERRQRPPVSVDLDVRSSTDHFRWSSIDRDATIGVVSCSAESESDGDRQ